MPRLAPPSPRSRVARLAVALVWLGCAAAASACSSEPVAPGADLDASGGGGGGDGGIRFDGSIPTSKCPAYVAPKGKGTATTETGTLADLPEIACRTLRKRDGSVVGYAVSFGRFQPIGATRLRAQMEKMDRFNIEAYGYTGDGEIAPANVSYSVRRADGSSSGGAGKLVISQGGKRGVFTGGVGDRDVLEFECDPSDDTAPTAGPALTDAPGRAIVERERGGDAHVLEGIHCKESAPSSIPNLTITHPFPFLGAPSEGACVPHDTLLEAKVNGAGTYALEPGSYVVTDLVEVGFVGTSVNGKTEVTLTAAGPAKGTFKGTTPSGAGGRNFNGSFTCPSP